MLSLFRFLQLIIAPLICPKWATTYRSTFGKNSKKHQKNPVWTDLVTIKRPGYIPQPMKEIYSTLSNGTLKKQARPLQPCCDAMLVTIFLQYLTVSRGVKELTFLSMGDWLFLPLRVNHSIKIAACCRIEHRLWALRLPHDNHWGMTNDGTL